MTIDMNARGRPSEPIDTVPVSSRDVAKAKPPKRYPAHRLVRRFI